MPRVHHVKKARKDNPAVKAGESYYWWKFPYAGKRCSATHPRPSQLTQSDKLSRYREAEETIDDLDAYGFPYDIADKLDEVAETVHEIAEEYQESADNIRDYFEESPTADECEEKYEACEATADSIVAAAEAIRDLEIGPGDRDTVSDIVIGISWEM